ncbi:MAG TPA: formyltetrahydrofolate deformylase [Nitrososphaeraceae archaeon]
MKKRSTFIEITVVGKDRKGVIADITNFIFSNDGNIDELNQNVVNGLFGMHLKASFQNIQKENMSLGMKNLGKKLGMEIKIHYQEPERIKNVAIFVSKEGHCLTEILDSKMNGKMLADKVVIIGSERTLESVAKRYKIPFYHIIHKEQSGAELEILRILERYNVDLIVLGRYMRILTPNFVWRYPNRIINIHPSLLPAFPGAYAYVQAYERGAKIVGCTAHFVTEDLDQGPIICQDSFRVLQKDSIKSIQSRGQKLESKTLLAAVRLYLADKLEVNWGKVLINKTR